MIGLVGGELTLVEAREKLEGKMVSVSVFCKPGACDTVTCEEGLSIGELGRDVETGGRHWVHSGGKT